MLLFVKIGVDRLPTRVKGEKVMTREQKIEWLKNASNEELMEQYDISLKYREKDIFNKQYLESLELCKNEILRRMSK